MAIFKRTKKEKVVSEPASEKKSAARVGTGTLSWVLISPRVTEKASGFTTGAPVYAFNVSLRANKIQIAQAVEALYKVRPTQVRIVSLPSKATRSRRGVSGRTSRGKKAYVFLKKGDTIVFA